MSDNPYPTDHDAIASYLPRAFCIDLHSFEFQKPPQGSRTPSFSTEELPTIMHEVAHLVQDRATFRGVLDFMDLWDRVSAVSQHVRACGNKIFFPLVDVGRGRSRLPEHLRWSVETEMLLNLREPRIRWESHERYWAYQAHSVTRVQARLAGRPIDYPQVTVDFIDNASGDTYQHVLGAREIKEAHSVAVALLHGGNVKALGLASYEYLVVERILSFFFGEVSPRQVIALCHWALQDLAPANSLFSIIEHFFEDGEPLPDENTIYDWARSETINRGFRQNVAELLNNVKEYDAHYGRQNDVLASLFRWFHDHAAILFESQIDHERRFPLDTFLCANSQGFDEEAKKAGLRALFAEVEVPLLIYPDGDFYSISRNRDEASKIAFFCRSQIDLLTRLWASGAASWQCPLYRGCLHAMRDDSECLKTPWKKANLHHTCAYGAVARIMELNEKNLQHEPFDEESDS